jgi:ribA/ribD-fused uncharacterized protein
MKKIYIALICVLLVLTGGLPMHAQISLHSLIFYSQETDMIDSFKGENRFLSNFWPAEVQLLGMKFPTVEHAYVAAKTTDLEKRAEIQKVSTAGQVKRLGRTLTLREDWDEIKLSVMEDLVRQKFQHPELAALLLATGDQELVEGNTWGDTFWGVCFDVGCNHLGLILMKVRDELA